MKMRMFKCMLALTMVVLLLPACNKGEGKGGTGTIEGYVKLVQHPDDDYQLNTDTVNAAKTDVFIVYGDDKFYGDDVETGPDGLYRFEYLRPGHYTVFAYSTMASGEKVAVSQSVDMPVGAVFKAPTIYIHDGKAYGTSVVKGKVYATYYHNGTYRGEGWAYEHRVYIRKAGQNLHFDDTRVGPEGEFAFQKLLPGDYEVFTVDESFNEVPSFIFQSIHVDEAGKVYELENQFDVIINV